MSRRFPAASGSLCSFLALLVACESPATTTPASADPPSPVSEDADEEETASPQSAEPLSVSAPSGPPAVVVSVDDDRVLRTLRERAPAGWRVLAEEDRVVIERVDLVWVLAENRINAPPDDDSAAATAARVMKYGRQMRSRIVYRAEEGWSPQRVRSTREDNARVHEKLGALADVHRVRHLVDAATRRKHSDPRAGATAEELPRIDLYLHERAQLEAKVHLLPAFLGERYALFGPEYEGWSDQFHLVYPPAAAEESYRVDLEVRSLLAATGAAIE